VITLHMPATDETKQFVNADRIAKMRDNAILINTARGTLVNEADIAEACQSGKLLGYATDVLAEEPMQTPHPFQQIDNILVTPHVGSRTYESVERQAVRATQNIVNFLQGSEDYIQANEF
jgi:D-3-phosphoglycerate dehydrogenase